MLDPEDPNPFFAEVIEGEKRGFFSAQPVAIDDIEKEQIARVIDLIEEAFDLLFREVLDGLLIPPSKSHRARVLRTRSDSNVFSHKRLLGRGEEGGASQSATRRRVCKRSPLLHTRLHTR